MSDPVRVKTLPQLAKDIGMHRSTLVRLEQRGIISKAPIAPHPVQGRIYDAALEKKVKAEIDAYLAQKRRDDSDRPTPPSKFILAG